MSNDKESSKALVNAPPAVQGVIKDMEGIFTKFRSQERDIIKGDKTGNPLKSPDKELAVFDTAITQMLTFAANIRAVLPDEELQSLIDAINLNAQQCAQLYNEKKDKEKHILNTAKAEAAFKGFSMPISAASGGDAEKLKLFGISLEEREIAWNALKEALLELNGKQISQDRYADKIIELSMNKLANKNYNIEKLDQFKKFITQGKQDKKLTAITGQGTVEITDESHVQQITQVAIKIAKEFSDVFILNTIDTITIKAVITALHPLGTSLDNAINSLKQPDFTKKLDAFHQANSELFSKSSEDSAKILSIMAHGNKETITKKPDVLSLALKAAKNPDVFRKLVFAYNGTNINPSKNQEDTELRNIAQNWRDHPKQIEKFLDFYNKYSEPFSKLTEEGAKIFSIMAHGNKKTISKKPDVLSLALQAAKNPDVFRKLVFAYNGINLKNPDDRRTDEELRKIAQKWRDHPEYIDGFSKFYENVVDIYNKHIEQEATKIKNLLNTYQGQHDATIELVKNEAANLIYRVVGQDRFNNIHLLKEYILKDPKHNEKLALLETYWQNSLGVKSSEKLYEYLNKDTDTLKVRFAECLNYSPQMWDAISQRAADFKLDMRKEQDWKKLQKIAELEKAIENNNNTSLTNDFKRNVIDRICQEAAKSGNLDVLDIAIAAAKNPDAFKNDALEYEKNSYGNLSTVAKLLYNKLSQFDEKKFTSSRYFADIIESRMFGKESQQEKLRRKVIELSENVPALEGIETTYFGSKPTKVERQGEPPATTPRER